MKFSLETRPAFQSQNSDQILVIIASQNQQRDSLLARIADRNFVVRIARSESCYEISQQELLLTSLAERNFVARLASFESCRKYIAFFPSHETCETHKTRTDIFTRSETHFPQNSRKKNCEMRLAVNPTTNAIKDAKLRLHLEPAFLILTLLPLGGPIGPPLFQRQISKKNS